MKTKQKALIAARILKAQLRGKGWKIRVWENLGWHASVETNRISVTVSENSCTPYICLLKPHYCGFGPAQHGWDPMAIVKRTIQNAAKSIAADHQIVVEANSIYEH